MKSYFKYSSDQITYTVRVQLSLVLVLVLLLITLKILPHTQLDGESEFAAQSDTQITLDLIDIPITDTRPPTPVRPLIRPNIPEPDEIEEDLLLDLGFPGFDEESLLDAPTADGVAGEIVAAPERRPRVTRIVEPVTPDGVLSRGMRVRVTVRFLVAADGSVEEFFIQEIQEFDQGEGRFVVVPQVGNAIIEATIEAARQWRFRAAEHEGNTVAAWSDHIFSFGRN